MSLTSSQVLRRPGWGGFGGFCCRVSDVDAELIVTADMLAYPFERHKNLALLSSTLKK